MKSSDIDALLNGLLGDTKVAPTAGTTPQPAPKRSAASDEARRRVEEIMRSVDLESSRKKAQAQTGPAVQTIPRREPVVVPEPISHFSDEPSQNPAVRMHDRLDEVSLPMIDTERKPTQIIPPKPKPEPQRKKKRKKRPAQEADKTKIFPAEQKPVTEEAVRPAEKPKRKIPHIEVPDEFPPDPALAEPVQEVLAPAAEPPKRSIPHIEVPDEFPPDPEAQLIVREEKKASLKKKKWKASPVTVPDAPPAEPEERVENTEPSVENTNADMLHLEPPVPFEKLMGLEEEITITSDEKAGGETAKPEPEKASETEKKRKIMHIQVPDELPPDIPRDTSIADEIRRKKAGEIITEPAAEEPPAETASAVQEPEDAAENEVPAASEPAAAAPEQPKPVTEKEQPRLRHLSMPAEKTKKERGGLLGIFSRKKKQSLTEETAENEEPPKAAPDDEETDTSEEDLLISEPDTPEESEETAEALSEPEMLAELPDADEEKALEEAASASIDVTLPGEKEKKHKKAPLMSALREALDENAQELADMKTDPIPEDDEIDVKVGRARFWRRNRYFVVGILCSVLAVIGLATCVMYGVRAVQRFAAGSSLSSQLERSLYPAAVVDLAPFEKVEEADMEGLLSAAVIHMIMYEDLSAYPCSFDMMTIPAEDIRLKASEMFGADLHPEYTTLQAAGEVFFYDEAAGTYNVPVSPVIFSYAPKVQEVRISDDGVYTVTVAYQGDTAQWQQYSGKYVQDMDKTMEITMRKEQDTYQIVRIVNISGDSGQGM